MLKCKAFIDELEVKHKGFTSYDDEGELVLIDGILYFEGKYCKFELSGLTFDNKSSACGIITDDKNRKFNIQVLFYSN